MEKETNLLEIFGGGNSCEIRTEESETGDSSQRKNPPKIRSARREWGTRVARKQRGRVWQINEVWRSVLKVRL